MPVPHNPCDYDIAFAPCPSIGGEEHIIVNGTWWGTRRQHPQLDDLFYVCWCPAVLRAETGIEQQAVGVYLRADELNLTLRQLIALSAAPVNCLTGHQAPF